MEKTFCPHLSNKSILSLALDSEEPSIQEINTNYMVPDCIETCLQWVSNLAINTKKETTRNNRYNVRFLIFYSINKLILLINSFLH